MRRRRLLGQILLAQRGPIEAGQWPPALRLVHAIIPAGLLNASQKRFWVFVGLFLLLASQPVMAEGPGVMLGGRLVLHPGLATELRYDSNVFLSNLRTGDGLPASSVVLRILPSFDLSTLSLRQGGLTPSQVEFKIHAGLDYREYLSVDKNLTQHRAFGVEAGALLSLFPRTAYNFEIYDNFLRTNQPPYSFNPYNIDRHTNTLGARFRYSPGGQRLTLAVLYEFGYDGFEDVYVNEQRLEFSLYNLLSNALTLRGSWRFLPKTALFVEINQVFNTYLADSQYRNGVVSYPLRVSVGLVGLITQRLAINLLGGYGNGFYEYGPSPSTAIINAEVKYRPTILNAVTLSYRHDFVNTIIASYFDLDSVSVGYSQLLYRVSLYARFSWDRMAYRGSEEALKKAGICEMGEIEDCVGQNNRVDNYLVGDIKAEMPMRDWFLVGVGYTIQSNMSSGYNRVQSAIVPASFTKHEAWLRLTLRY